jgi:hypothetical protein
MQLATTIETLRDHIAKRSEVTPQIRRQIKNAVFRLQNALDLIDGIPEKDLLLEKPHPMREPPGTAALQKPPGGGAGGEL